jgi:O-antigen/teichoic acid export membrane protein
MEQRSPTPAPSPRMAPSSAKPGPLRTHLHDPLYRTGYLLSLGTGATALLGFGFWVLAARSYPASVVGLGSATISAMMLVSGVCSLGLNAVLVRYLPVAGRSTHAFVVRAYAITVTLAFGVGAGAALTSALWSPTLRFLAQDSCWFAGFTLATALWTVFSLQDSVLTGLRAARWVPIENSLFALAKLILLVAVAGTLPFAGPFVAWNAPVAVAVPVISLLIFGHLIPRHPESPEAGELDVRRLVRAAAGNYGGTVFALAGATFMPVLVANTRSATETAYFYVPWTISAAVQSIALNMTASLTVEAALDQPRLRRLCRRTLAHSMRLLSPFVVVASVAAPLILRAFGQPYADAGSTLLRLLLAGALPNVVVALGLAVARIEHRGGAILAIQAAQCLLVLGLSTVLLRGRLGIDGVGIGWLASQLIVAATLAAGLLRPLLLPCRSHPPSVGSVG